MDKKEIFYIIQEHLLNDDKPSIYLEEALENGVLDEYPFSMIKDLKYVEQNPRFHPEGDVFVHTMMVIDEGAKNRYKSKNKKSFMWALLLHDLGKKTTTKVRKGKITSYNHDIEGKVMAKEFLEYFNEDNEFINEVASLVRWHMQSLFVTKATRFQNIEEMLEEVDKDEIVLVALSDRLGRGNINNDDLKNTKKDIDKFRNMVNDKFKKKLK